MDLLGHHNVKLRPRYAPWGRQIDLPDGLPFEPVLGLLLSHLCCRRQLLDGCEPLPGASWGCSIGQRAYCRPLLLRYSSSPTSLQHADATGSGICQVVPRVGRASQHPRLEPNGCPVILPPELKRLFCAISIMVWARGLGILWRRVVCPTSSIARYSSSASIASIFPTSEKFKCAMEHGLLGESVGHQTGRGHPQDDEGDLAVFLAITRVTKVGKLGIKVVPGDLRIFLHYSVNIPEHLNSMTLLAMFLVDPVEALGPFPGS